MKTVHRPSVIPIYGIGLVWLLCAVIFPLYKLSFILLCAALSAVAFFLLKVKFPGTEEQVAEPAPDLHTGDAELDALLRQGRKQLQEIRQINDQIEDVRISARLEQLEGLADKIFRRVEEKPELQRQTRRFMEYYLPTTIKLLRKYQMLQKQTVKGENITRAIESIEKMLDTVVVAFGRQLDNLFANETVDITADIEVLEQMMAGEGLTGEKDF